MDCSKKCQNFSAVNEVEKVKNIAIIVGHTKESQGAETYNGESEYIFNTRVAEIVSKRLNSVKSLEAKIFFRDNGGLYGAANEIKEHFKTVDMTFELHFNAFKKVAFGTECLIAENGGRYQDYKKCFELADILTDRFSEIYNMRERHDDGVKAVEKGDRGEYNLRIMHRITKTPVALLFEPCFMNIKNRESEQIVENERAYALNVASIIAGGFFGLAI